MGSHQVGRPEPSGQRQLGVVHDRAGGHRGLLAAAGALVGPRLGLQFPGLGLAAARADKAVWPARRVQVGSAGCLILEAVLELDQRTRKITHDGLALRLMFDVCSITNSPIEPLLIDPPEAEGQAFDVMLSSGFVAFFGSAPGGAILPFSNRRPECKRFPDLSFSIPFFCSTAPQ